MLAVMIPAFAVTSSAATTVTDWEDTKNPIVLMTTDDFTAFRQQIRGGNDFSGQTVVLGADLVFPAGSSFDYNKANYHIDSSKGFLGTFDGQGHTIYNLSVECAGYGGAVFGAIKSGLTTPVVIKNVSFVNTLVSASSRPAVLYSGVWSSLTVENVYIQVAMTRTDDTQSAGGFIGHTSYPDTVVSFTNCVFEGSITDKPNNVEGAFIGRITVTNPYANPTVTLTNCLNISTLPLIGANDHSTNATYPYTPSLTSNINYTGDTVTEIGTGIEAQSTWLNENGYSDWSATNTGAPLPSTIANTFFKFRTLTLNEDTITLYNACDFKDFHDKIIAKETFANKTVKLDKDINMTGFTLTKVTEEDQGFLGTFDGQYHTISGITATLQAYYGIFGSVGEGVTSGGFKNLAIKDSTFSTFAFCGVFYGNVHGSTSFENVCLNISIAHGAASAMGGFIGRMTADTATVSFKNCAFDGTITTTSTSNNAYSYSPFVGALEKIGSASFENCLIYGNFTRMQNANNIWLGAGKFVLSFGDGCAAKTTYNNCIQYNDYYQNDASGQTYAVCPELVSVGSGFGAKTPEGWTALNEGYPVPNTLLPFFMDKVAGARTAQTEALVTEHYAYQTNADRTSIRFVAAVNGAADGFTAVGHEIIAVTESGKVWTNVVEGAAPDVTTVYTSVLEDGVSKAASDCGGDYVFVSTVNGIAKDVGTVTFIVKTFSKDAEGNVTYSDMCVIKFDTASV